MNTFICSINTEVCERLESLLSDNKIEHKLISSVNELIDHLSNISVVNIVFHLDNNVFTEIVLTRIQSQFKEKINTLVLSNTPDADQGIRLLSNNIRGYANSFLAPQKFLVALSVIEQGEIWAGAILIDHILHKTINNSSLEDKKNRNTINGLILKQLSEREQQIAQHISIGQTNHAIADDLFISERTVKAHLTSIYKKLNIRNRLELTLKLSDKH